MAMKHTAKQNCAEYSNAGPLKEQSGPGANINTGPSLSKGLLNCSCRVLSNYKWMSVWHNWSEIDFLSGLFFFFFAPLGYEQDVAV